MFLAGSIIEVDLQQETFEVFDLMLSFQKKVLTLLIPYKSSHLSEHKTCDKGRRTAQSSRSLEREQDEVFRVWPDTK